MIFKLWRYRYGTLLFSLFTLLFLTALDPNSAFVEEMFLTAFTLVLISSLYVMYRRSFAFYALSTIGIVSFFLNILAYTFPLSPVFLIATFINIMFIFWVVLSLVSHIFNSPRVNFDVVLGAACLYLMLGIFFSFIYTWIDYIAPHSFSGKIAADVHGIRALFSSFLYYSFVTLTTLGYGDILPLSAPARLTSVIEAVFAQLYITIFMARMVGLHLTHYSKT